MEARNLAARRPPRREGNARLCPWTVVARPWFLGLALAVAVWGAEAARAAALKVLALGDSITVGVGSSHHGGYRATFWTRMRDAGFEIDMVGGKNDGADTFDNAPPGRGPARPSPTSARACTRSCAATSRTSCCCSRAATRHTTTHFSAHAFAANLGVLIDRVFTAKRDVKLLISTIPPARFGRNQGTKRALNELVRRTVRERAERGQAVYLVDSFATLDPTRDMADTDHPNDAGYERIGEAFADALLAALGAERLE